MKHQMQAEILFPDARDVPPAIVALKKLGFEIEVLDWVDEHEGELLSETLWLMARIESELSQDEFLTFASELAEELNGDVVEAGLRWPFQESDQASNQVSFYLPPEESIPVDIERELDAVARKTAELAHSIAVAQHRLVVLRTRGWRLLSARALSRQELGVSL
jgi:hypothetical protein